MKNVRFVGLDVHAESIAVAVAEAGSDVHSLGVIPNRAESVGRLIRKLGKPEQLRVCYEAGPTGFHRDQSRGHHFTPSSLSCQYAAADGLQRGGLARTCRIWPRTCSRG
jgi:hypothetical protein